LRHSVYVVTIDSTTHVLRMFVSTSTALVTELRVVSVMFATYTDILGIASQFDEEIRSEQVAQLWQTAHGTHASIQNIAFVRTSGNLGVM